MRNKIKYKHIDFVEFYKRRNKMDDEMTEEEMLEELVEKVVKTDPEYVDWEVRAEEYFDDDDGWG